MENNDDIHALESIDELHNYNNYIYKKILKYLQPGLSLDFGCGFGNFLKFIKKETKLNFVGYEVNRIALEKLEKESITYVKNIDNANEYDNIVSLNVLEHIDDDTEVFNNFNRILKPEGRLVLYLPHSMVLWSSLDNLVGHKRRYTKKDLSKKLENSNFNIEKIEYVDFIGSVVLLIFKILRLDLNYKKSRLIFYDKSVFRLFKYLDMLTKNIFGKNILVVANVKG